MNAPEIQTTWEMRASFTATRDQAQRLKETLEASAAVFFDPSEENASVLFRLGAEAVVGVAQMERERGGSRG